jgi:flavodoxin
MKRTFLFFVTAFCIGGLSMEAQTQSGGKILVAYFSYTGNAKALSEQIARETGGDLFEIKRTAPFPKNYNDVVAMAIQELYSNARPAVSERVGNMAQYNTVFLCFPCWEYNLPAVCSTFLESYDFSGKTIYPLVTHGGSRFAGSLDTIKKLCPRATIGEGLAVYALDKNPNDAPVVRTPNNDITTWLRKIGMAAR